MFINWPVNPDYNITIECQGEQHFKPVEPWGGEKQFETNKKRDELKKELCKENGVELFYYTEPRFMKYLLENNEASFSNIEKIYEKIFGEYGTLGKRHPPLGNSFIIFDDDFPLINGAIPGLTENSFYRKLFLLHPREFSHPGPRENSPIPQGSLFENPIFI